MFELGTIDVVLGYTWLEKLEETRINWGLHIMKFQVHDKWVTIDQKSLRHLLEQRAVSVEQQKWASKLWGLNYTIEYRPGKENRVADALSRQHRVAKELTELHEFQLTASLSIDRSNA